MWKDKNLHSPRIPDPYGRLCPIGTMAELWNLDRNDDQIKVRSCRIEPGDTEAAPLREAEVARCIVVARQDTPGDVRLAA